MGFFKRIYANWKAKPTKDKIDTVIDIITMLGSGIGGASVGKKLGEGHNIASRVCISVTCSGLSMAAGDIAAKQLKSSYGEPLAEVIDRVKAKKGEAT